QESGVVLNAEMLTPVPQYQGLLRLKAEVLQQVNRQRYEAYNAALTSSRIGNPRYWFQTRDVTIDDLQTPVVDPLTNQPLLAAIGAIWQCPIHSVAASWLAISKGCRASGR